MTLLCRCLDVPSDMRLESLQAAVLLLPDENREVLQSLLLFLSDMAEHSAENQVHFMEGDVLGLYIYIYIYLYLHRQY